MSLKSILFHFQKVHVYLYNKYFMQLIILPPFKFIKNQVTLILPDFNNLINAS